MQLINKSETFANICFYIGMGIHLLVMVVGYSDFSLPYTGRLLQVAFGFLCLKILMTYYTRGEWIALLLTGALGALSYLFTRDEYVVSVVVMIFACKNADIMRFLKVTLWTAFAATAVISILSLFGIGGMAVDIRDYGRGGEEARWCLGFGHANNFHGTLWYLMLLTVLIYYGQLTWQHYLGMTVVNVAIFILTVSRSGFLATQFVIVAGFLIKYTPKIVGYCRLYLLGILEIAGVVLISIAAVMVPFHEYPVLSVADRLLTGRLQLAYRHANISQWKLFSTGTVTDMVDNGWITLFFSYGYVIGILYIAFHVYLVYRAWKTQNRILLVILMSSVFYTFMESSYTINSAYLLCNASYIVAMVFIAGTGERRGFTNNGREKIERDGNRDLSV